jgi:hypothetical protein
MIMDRDYYLPDCKASLASPSVPACGSRYALNGKKKLICQLKGYRRISALGLDVTCDRIEPRTSSPASNSNAQPMSPPEFYQYPFIVILCEFLLNSRSAEGLIGLLPL